METLNELSGLPERKKPENAAPTKELAREAIFAAFRKKATNVVVMDIREVSGIADYFVICTGDSQRQIKAIADGIREDVREALGEKPWRSEGYKQQEWILLDYVDVVVHVFNEEKRTHFGLERLWGDAPREEIQDGVTEIVLLGQ
ncbi:MAG: ribosome silencing factor [Rhodothermia bacterium]|nr:ribosome silencing factor [Rhodothermia bacterium]